MAQKPKRLRRCQLAVPGSSDKMMTKAASLDVDHIFLDLEDAVAPAAKIPARAQIVTALNTLDWGKSVRCVRINDLDTQYAYEDIIEVVEGASANLDTILVPKVRSACDVRFVDRLLSQIELKLGLTRKIGIEVLIEEAEAIMNVEEIASASERLEALVFGMGDYSASQGIDPRAVSGDTGYPGDIWHYARYKVIVAKWAIHPSQVAIAQEVFSPAQDELDKAHKAVAAYREAQAQGLGAIQVDGQMVDVATVRLVQGIIDQAEAIGMKPTGDT